MKASCLSFAVRGRLSEALPTKPLQTNLALQVARCEVSNPRIAGNYLSLYLFSFIFFLVKKSNKETNNINAANTIGVTILLMQIYYLFFLKSSFYIINI